MTKIQFKDLPDRSTPRNATNLNNLNNVSVGATEPTLDEELWVKEPLNIFDGILEVGEYDANGIKINSSGRYRNVNPIRVSPNTTYTISINGTKQKYVMFAYDKNMNFLNSFDNQTGTFTSPNNCEYINFRCYAADYVSTFNTLKVQVELGNIATSYTTPEPSVINTNNNGTYQKLTDTVSVGVDSNNSGLWVENSKNQWKGEYINFSLGGTSGAQLQAASNCRTAVVLVKPNTTYTITKYAGTGTGNRMTIANYSSYVNTATDFGSSNKLFSGDTATTTTVTTNSTAKYLYVYVTNDTSNIPNVMVNYGSSKLDYETPVLNPSIKANNNGVYETVANKNVYSTSEVVIGEWLGKPLYRKVVSFGALPNNTTKEVATGTTNIDEMVNIKGFSYNSQGFTLPLPYADPTNLSYCVSASYRKSSNTVSVLTKYDRSSYTTSYLILEYTKTN